MFRRRKIQRSIIWTVLLAVLFNIALPALSATTAFGTDRVPSIMGEICTSSGAKIPAMPGVDRAPDNHADLLHDGHCQLCPLGSAIPAPRDAARLPIAIQAPLAWMPGPSEFIRQHTRCVPPPSHAPPVLS